VDFLSSGGSRYEGQSMGFFAKSPSHTVLDLNGGWEYRSADDDVWHGVTIPSSYLGKQHLIFRREFSVDLDLANRSVFQFAALSISYYCEISINGQFIGKHAGNTSFSIKIPQGIIKAGTNTIEIDVNNFLNAHETVPVIEKLWNPFNYGGIVQDIAIAANGAVWVQETTMRTVVSGEGKPVTVNYLALLNSGTIMKVKPDSASDPASLSRLLVDHYFELIDPNDGSVVFKSEAVRVQVESDRLTPASISATISNVRLWSPEYPATYIMRQRTFRGSIMIDESYQYVGFKSFEVQGTRFALNGAPYFLKGITYTEGTPMHGRSLSIDEMERDVLLIKNLGANCIRIMSGSVHPYFLELCDKYGVLVFLDLNAHGVPSSVLARQPIQTTMRNIYRETVARDGNHPCLAAIGLAGCVDMTADGFNKFFDAIIDRSQGPAPHLHYASFSTLGNKDISKALDFVAVDLQHLDLPRSIAFLDAVRQHGFDRPVMIGSIIHGVEIGNYNGYSDPRSIDAQAQYYLDLYPEVLSREFPGAFFAPFSDNQLLVPAMTCDRVYEFFATTGIVDGYRQKRMAYDVLKAKFNNEKPPVVVIGNYSESHPAVFVVTGIFLILIFAVVYNLFRRFRENVVRALMRPFNFYTDVRDQRMLSIFQTTVVGILGSLSASLFHANVFYFLKTDFYFDSLLAQLVPCIWLKQWLNFSSWNPTSNIIVSTVFIYLVLLLFSFILRAISFFFRKKILLFDAYCVSMWSILPMALLAPFGMVLYRLMDYPFFEFLAIITLIIFTFWIISRLLKGTAIVLDSRPVFFYIGGYLLIAAVLVAGLISMNGSYETFAHIKNIFNLWYFVNHVV
jgi:hypothetical protein